MAKAKQDEAQHRTITVPVVGYYTVQNGKIIENHFDYATIPTKTFVDFLLAKFGLDPERLLQNEA